MKGFNKLHLDCLGQYKDSTGPKGASLRDRMLGHLQKGSCYQKIHVLVLAVFFSFGSATCFHGSSDACVPTCITKKIILEMMVNSNIFQPFRDSWYFLRMETTWNDTRPDPGAWQKSRVVSRWRHADLEKHYFASGAPPPWQWHVDHGPARVTSDSWFCSTNLAYLVKQCKKHVKSGTETDQWLHFFPHLPPDGHLMPKWDVQSPWKLANGQDLKAQRLAQKHPASVCFSPITSQWSLSGNLCLFWSRRMYGWNHFLQGRWALQA